MKRQLLLLFALSFSIVCTSVGSASAAGPGSRSGHNFGHGQGRGFDHGFGIGGIAFGGGYDGGWDIADLYRQLYQNLPYFALHPPVYYSYPVPRTYGYSPFAYGPEIMTPDVAGAPQPVTIDNPYVPQKVTPAPTDAKSTDRSAASSHMPEPLVIVNPFVSPASNVAQSGK